MDACAERSALIAPRTGITARWAHLTFGNDPECATMQAAACRPSRKEADETTQTSPVRIRRGDPVRPPARGQHQTPGNPDARSR